MEIDELARVNRGPNGGIPNGRVELDSITNIVVVAALPETINAGRFFPRLGKLDEIW